MTASSACPSSRCWQRRQWRCLRRGVEGGCWYEPKFDGYRALVFVGDQGACVQSRRGSDITAAFRDVAEAAAARVTAQPPAQIGDPAAAT
jgi:ATP-dependent DNA ligase